jgi:nucleotide-binding universal stress UspA family protein
MARRPMRRLFEAVARAAQRRDQIEMQAIDRLLSPLALKQARRAKGVKRGRGPKRLRRGRQQRNHQTGPFGGFRSILCPVDFSKESRVALRYAEALAKRSHGHLSVLFVNDPLLIAAAAVALHDRTLAKRSGAELSRFVESTLSPNAAQPVLVDHIVATGTPVAEIAKAARRRRCDLIVMGAHGLTGADKLFMGSTTQSVLRQTTVPVLAVPTHASAKKESLHLERSWPGKRIVAAIALDGRSMRDARAAGAVAQWFGSSLQLVHVVPEFKAPPWLHTRIGANDRARITHARSRLEAIAARMRHHDAVETRVLFGNASDAIAALSAAERPGLVITGLRTADHWLGPRRGSISYHLLLRANTPVLALPG